MRTFKHLFTALFMLLCSAAVSAQDFEVDGIRYNVTSVGGKTVQVVSSNTKYTGSLVIPETVPFNDSFELKENFGNWTSTNKNHSTTSQTSYTIDAEAGDILYFDWAVSSETGCDWLIVTIDGVEVLKKSGSQSDSYIFTFDTAGTHTLNVKYTKDGSQSTGSDQGSVSNVSLNVVVDGNVTAYRVTGIAPNAFKNCSGLTGIELPSSVTSIGSDAFYGCSGLTGIEIPSSVTSIGPFAFYGCSSLTGIEIPSGVTCIGRSTFSGCSGLTSVVIPNSITSIVYDAFKGCSSLTGIEIPSGVTIIESSVFYGCRALASVTIPEGVTSIGNSAFYGCSGLTSIKIPSSVTNIDSYAFYGCSNLAEVTSEAVAAPYLGDNVFSYLPYNAELIYPVGSNYLSWAGHFGNFEKGWCGSDIQYIIDNEGFCYIWGTGVIEYNLRSEKIKSVYIDEGITEIADYAFQGDYNLAHVHLPNSLTKIGEYAFNGCPIKAVIIPSSVESIGDYAFETSGWNDEEGNWVEMDFNTCCIFKSMTAPLMSYNDINIVCNENAVGYDSFSYGSISHWSTGNEYFVAGDELIVWGNVNYFDTENSENIKQAYIIPNGENYNTIRRLVNLESLYLDVHPLKVTVSYEDVYTINGSNAVLRNNGGSIELVAGCAATKIPNNVKVIENFAFQYCSGLTSIEIPNSVTRIGIEAFYDCSGLTSIEIPNSVTSIESSTFAGCSGLTSVVIPNSVTSIGSGAFSGCSSLTGIEIPNSVTSIESSAFYGCSSLTGVVIPNSITRIGSGAFSCCSSLTGIEIPSSVTSIGGDAFSGCSGITNISVAAGNAIYDSRGNCNAIIESASNRLLYAFSSTVIPADVTTIAGYAFCPLQGLDVTVPANILTIENSAFSGVKNIYFESTVPASITGNIFGSGIIYVPAVAYETYCNADVWKDYSSRIVTTEIADRVVTVEAAEGMSGVLDAIGLDDVEKVVKLKVIGSINSYDIIVFRDKMLLLSELDLSEATVVASSKPFYQTYSTGNNSLGGYAFYDLDKLVSVKLPKDLKTLGNYAFSSCGKLKSVDATAAPGLEISANAFYDCDALEEILLPQNVAFIGSHAFYDCRALQSVEIGSVEGDIDTNAFEYCRNLSTVRIDSVGGSIKSRAFQTYSWDSGSKLQSVDIKIIGGDIENNAFGSCSMLKNVEIDSIGGGIEQYAFRESGVETMYFGAVGRLDTYSLGGCPKLKSVTIGNGPATIPSRLFVNSHNIESFVVEEGVTEVADNAFYYSGYLTTNYYSEYVTSQLKALKRVKLPESVQRIGKYAFNECTALSDFNIPKGVTSIGSNAFFNCDSLKSVAIPDGVTNISAHTFYSCSSLQHVTFPDSLVSIENYAFYDCSIEQIKLPPTVKSIGNNAFYYCRNLAELHIPSSVETIGNSAFSGCNKLNSVYTYTIEPTVITESTFSTFSTAKLYVPATSFWNYYWDIGWSKFNQKNFEEFNKPYDYFYLNNDYTLNDNTGYIEGTPDADLKPGSGLIVEGEEVEGEEPKQNLGDVDLEHDGDSVSSSIIAGGNLHIDNLFIKIKVNSGRWYFFAFPFDIKFKDIYMDNGSDYVFRYYDGEERAHNGHGGWKNVNENHLKAARGYIFQCAQSGVLILSIKDVKFKKEDKYNELIAHVTENMNDASWNFVGNPYLSYYDLANLNYTAPVTVWDGSKYVAIRPGDDDYHFSPYEAFFVQKPENQENIEYDDEQQMTKNQSKNKKEKQAAARRARGIDPERLFINLVLGNDVTTDRTRVVFNAKQTHNYETACDAAKFETEGVPQIYTMDNEGVRYAINERPVGNGVVFIGYTADADGYYTIEAARMDTKVFLYDALTGEKHYFEDGAYRFYTEAGTYEKRFSLGVRGDEATGIEEITENELAAVVAAVDGGIRVDSNVSATIYNAAGIMVAVQNGAGVVQLPAGTYIVCVGENNTKVVVK